MDSKTEIVKQIRNTANIVMQGDVLMRVFGVKFDELKFEMTDLDKENHFDSIAMPELNRIFHHLELAKTHINKAFKG
jgi:hypothetical protein